jgi:uncharacterized phiE125 gp8 family phage protein
MAVKVAQELSRDSWLAVSVAQLIKQLRGYPEDYPAESEGEARLKLAINAATRWAERYTERRIVGANLQINLDAFPAGVIELSPYPIRELLSVDYTDTAGVEQSIPVEDIQKDFSSLRGRLRMPNGWPATEATYNAVRIVVRVGYASAGLLPHDMQAGILMLAAHLHENASATTPVHLHQVPLGVMSLLGQFSVESL